ncbi:MAG TPA: GTPase, partial [Clostridiales bacterium]|nr:GTPase [Clostridiales bacterium]
DFHNFNVFFRTNPAFEVVAFTATQIPNIEGRVYPAELAGELYPEGIPIHSEDQLPRLIRDLGVDQVVFAYSDVSHEYVMHKASTVLAAGADFVLQGPQATMLESKKPVVAVCAVRTGSGKSQTTRRVSEVLKDAGKKVAVVRHPMPYGDLVRQTVQRFATYEDLDRHECTIEEREEYEPHLDRGSVVYAGVDYEAILRQAEEEADVILWDGGNNDVAFYRPDVYITVADPHRPGHETAYHPGETNLRLADVVVINKVDTARPEDVAAVRQSIAAANPEAVVIEAASPVTLSGDGESLRGRKVLVVEDGPTLTHGEMPYGAGTIAARRHGAELVDPRPYAVGSIAETFRKYPHIGPLLPAMGYGSSQMSELAETIAKTPADVVVIGTPIDLRRVIELSKPAVRVRYELQEIGRPTLADVLAPLLE